MEEFLLWLLAAFVIVVTVYAVSVDPPALPVLYHSVTWKHRGQNLTIVSADAEALWRRYADMRAAEVRVYPYELPDFVISHHERLAALRARMQELSGVRLDWPLTVRFDRSTYLRITGPLPRV